MRKLRNLIKFPNVSKFEFIKPQNVMTKEKISFDVNISRNEVIPIKKLGQFISSISISNVWTKKDGYKFC